MKIIYKKVLTKLGVLLYRVNSKIAQQTLPKFANQPKKLRIELPRRIINPERIFIGNNVSLGPGTFMSAMTHYPSSSMAPTKKQINVQQFDSKIVIGNNVTSTSDLQIAAQSTITIEDDVLFASNIHLNNSLHGFETAEEPYRYQPLTRILPITIKRGSWIGQNVIILPGVTIGELSIIGANSLVSGDIPDRCIAFGNPARVVKKWDAALRRWIKV
jgi:acetyltransferase-like isoleucine patch superfamily enzyme